MNKLIGPIIIVAVLAVGIWYVARPQKETLGTASVETAAPTQAAAKATPIGELTADSAGQTVNIEGTITKECPHTGCWAVVKDDSGEIRIDTKKGGFALPLKREGSKIKVTGQVEVKENGDLEISASSAEL